MNISSLSPRKRELLILSTGGGWEGGKGYFSGTDNEVIEDMPEV